MIKPETMRITIVRINVARFELISETPIFPKRAVNAAKNAEAKAKNFQLVANIQPPLKEILLSLLNR
ncbi:MAG: hypothetical protein OHK0056_26000 [Bacteriovoracaceae bacterium]